MKAKIVSSKEFLKDNPTLCLKPIRAFNDCHKCDLFRHYNLKDKDLPCRPKFKKEIIERIIILLDERKKLQRSVNQKNKELHDLGYPIGVLND